MSGRKIVRVEEQIWKYETALIKLEGLQMCIGLIHMYIFKTYSTKFFRQVFC